MLRDARADDAPELARLHVLTWRTAYADLVPSEILERLDEASLTLEWRARIADSNLHTFVCESSEPPARPSPLSGYTSLRRSADADANANTGEILSLYVDPGRWRAGVGAALTAHALERAREAGFDRITLWVLRDNERARRFYEAQGFEYDGTDLVYDRLPGEPLHKVRYALSLA